MIGRPVALPQVRPIALAVLIKGIGGRDLVLFLSFLVVQVDILAGVVHNFEFARYPAGSLDQEAGDSWLNPLHLGKASPLLLTVTARQKEQP